MSQGPHPVPKPPFQDALRSKAWGGSGPPVGLRPASSCYFLQSPGEHWLFLQGPGQLISVIEETTSAECRQEVATTLLKLFMGQGLAKDFLDLLFQLELGHTSEAQEHLSPGRVGRGPL